MTCYIDVDAMRQLVARTGVERLMAGMAHQIRNDFLRWDQFQKSARTAHQSAGGVIELMPVSDDALYAFKYVNGHPGNPGLRLPTVMAFGVLAEVATGYPVLLSELTIATALRTAATSALAAKALARPDSRSMALIGNGAQAEFQALAFLDQLGIAELRVFDTDPRATDKLLANLAPTVQSGRLRVRRCSSVRDAVRGADIVTTATADKACATILSADLVEPGMHLNAVGGDCPGKTELDPAILRAAHVIVEYEPQTRIEGELQQMPADFAVTPLWRVLAGTAAGRRSPVEVTVFDSVGFALEDWSALRLIHRLARRLGLGRDIHLVPRMDDPKDLFAYLLGGAAPAVARACAPAPPASRARAATLAA